MENGHVDTGESERCRTPQLAVNVMLRRGLSRLRMNVFTVQVAANQKEGQGGMEAAARFKQVGTW